MLKKEGNLSIKTQVNTNNKPISDLIISEDALHISNKFRTLRDISTDSVVKTLFSYDYFNNNQNQNLNNNIRRNLFLMYVYDYFNLKLISDFENYLLVNNCELFDGNLEYVHFLFKGGNVYFHIISSLIDNNNLFNGINDEDKLVIQEEFSNCFKISDFDFTINMYCLSHQKFLKIKDYLIKFIIEILEEITIFFNQLLIKKLLSSENISKTITNNTYSFSANNDINLNNLPLNNTNQLLNTHKQNLSPTQNIILNTLKLINIIFSELYNNIFFKPFIDVVTKNNNIDLILIINNGNISDQFLDNYIKIITDFEKTKVRQKLRIIIENIREINNLLIYAGISALKPVSDKEFNANVINTLSKLIYINNKYSPKLLFPSLVNFKLQNFKSKQNGHFFNLEKLFNDINFYSDDLVIDIFKNIAEDLTKKIFLKNRNNENISVNKFYKEPKETFLFKNVLDYYDETNYESIKLKQNISDNDLITFKQIELSSTNDLIFQKDNYDTNLYISNKPNNFHYISHNSSIFSVLNNYSSIISFDLLRSKLNFQLNNVYTKKYLPDLPKNWKSSSIKIPSEFIDISIGCYEDSFYNTFSKNPNKYLKRYNFTINGLNFEKSNEFTVKSLSVNYFIHDLVTILFSQNTFYPWFDNKYEKRIKRLLFLYLIHDKNTTVPYLILINRISTCMLNYIRTGNLIDLQFINSLAKYDVLNDDFKNLAINIISHGDNLKSINFAHDNLYFNNIDELVNTLFFTFYMYYLNLDNSQIACDLINSQRKLYNFYNLDLNSQKLNYFRLYNDNVLNFITKIQETTTTTIRMYLIISANLPNFIV